MKIVLLVIGKTNEQYLLDGISKYQKRLQHYIQFEILEIPNIKKAKNLSNFELMKKEGKLILKQLQLSDYLVLLDDKGKDYLIDNKKKMLELFENIEITVTKKLRANVPQN